MEKRDTQFQRAIPIQKRVAVVLWRLSNGNSYRKISRTRAIGKSIAVEITASFCEEIWSLSLLFIISHVVDNKFQKQMNILNRGLIGVIDGNHVPIISRYSKLDYYCRKQLYLINTQTIADGKLLFLDLATRFSGSMHNTFVLRHICQISGIEYIDDDRLLNEIMQREIEEKAHLNCNLPNPGAIQRVIQRYIVSVNL